MGIGGADLDSSGARSSCLVLHKRMICMGPAGASSPTANSSPNTKYMHYILIQPGAFKRPVLHATSTTYDSLFVTLLAEHFFFLDPADSNRHTGRGSPSTRAFRSMAVGAGVGELLLSQHDIWAFQACKSVACFYCQAQPPMIGIFHLHHLVFPLDTLTFGSRRAGRGWSFSPGTRNPKCRTRYSSEYKCIQISVSYRHRAWQRSQIRDLLYYTRICMI